MNNKVTIPNFYYKKNQKLNKEKCEKEFLFYANIDSKWPSINISSINITGRGESENL